MLKNYGFQNERDFIELFNNKYLYELDDNSQKFLKELFRDVIDKFILSHKSYNISSSLELFQYKKPEYHINHQEFVRHCTSSLKINIKK